MTDPLIDVLSRLLAGLGVPAVAAWQSGPGWRCVWPDSGRAAVCHGGMIVAWLQLEGTRLECAGAGSWRALHTVVELCHPSSIESLEQFVADLMRAVNDH